MPMTPAQRKDAMPHGGQRRAADRIDKSETYISYVMNDLVEPKTPEGQRTLDEAREVLAEIMGKSVREAFGVETPASASSAA
jgi:hypothetical protein